MNYILIILAAIPILFAFVYFIRGLNEDKVAQRDLDIYLRKPLSNLEIGQRYEQYIGYLYESEGCNVEYHGINNGFEDLGRDLIIKNKKEVYIVQTKRWAHYKEIKVKDIFQLYGSMTHYRLSAKVNDRWVKAVFYTTAKYSKTVKEVAKVLGVELKNEKFRRDYPMIKCKVFADGQKLYQLPFDAMYDQININSKNGDFFVKTVREAVAQGFRREKKFNKAA